MLFAVYVWLAPDVAAPWRVYRLKHRGVQSEFEFQWMPVVPENRNRDLHFGGIRCYKSTLNDASEIGDLRGHAKNRDRTLRHVVDAGGDFRSSQQS